MLIFDAEITKEIWNVKLSLVPSSVVNTEVKEIDYAENKPWVLDLSL